MTNIKIKDSVLKEAAQNSFADFLNVIIDAINNGIGGHLDSDTMNELNADQITLLAYKTLCDEISVGGFVQLIYNGYGPFIFKNPFARILKNWGLVPLGQIIQKAHKYYGKYHSIIECEMDYDEFMALYEKCPEFDEFDDEFVASEDKYTYLIASYVDNNIHNFITIED